MKRQDKNMAQALTLGSVGLFLIPQELSDYGRRKQASKKYAICKTDIALR